MGRSMAMTRGVSMNGVPSTGDRVLALLSQALVDDGAPAGERG